MRAVVFRRAGLITIEDLPQPEPGPNEVVIRPYYAQICMTDVLNFDRWPPEWIAPANGRLQRDGKWGGVYTEGIVPGHEGGGEVVELGSNVVGLSIGDRLMVDATYRCGECPPCQQTRLRDCQVYGALNNRPGFRPTYLGINSGYPAKLGRGLMAEYCAVPTTMCYRVPDGVSDLATVGGEIGGPILTSVRTSGLQLGDNVVQIGGELYGSFRMQLCRVAGADRIIYVEPNEVRRRWAKDSNLADLVIDPKEIDPIEAVRSIFPGGADVVFVSNTLPGSWHMASKMVRRRGIVVPFESDPRLPHHYLDGFDGTLLNADGVRWMGDWPPIACGDAIKGGKSRNDHQIFIDLMQQGRVDGAGPVTKTVSLWDDAETIATAFTSPWTTEVRTAVRIWGE